MPERLLAPGPRSGREPVPSVDSEAGRLRLEPPPPGGAIRRDRLLHVLDAASRRRVTLVVAPAGYGKTTLVAQWAASSRSRRIGWLTLEASDDDPVRFQRMLRAALERAEGNRTRHPTSHHRPGDLPAVVVLDDVQAVSHSTLGDRVAANLESMPWLRLILVSRSDPFVPGFRLRLPQPVVELRRRDLAFDDAEAGELLSKLSRQRLTDVHVATLRDRTNGCVASLQLAALSLRGVDDVDGFVDAVAVDDRHAVDVLTERMLELQPSNVRRFLLHTSVLDQMNASLCDFVCGTTDGQAMLERLERGSMSLASLDDRRVWFRLHRLVRVLIRQHLRAKDPSAEQQLLERAATWHLAHDGTAEALGYLAQAEAWDELATTILRRGASMLLRGETGVVAQWVGLLPWQVRQARPTILLLEAADLLCGSPSAAVGPLLRQLQTLEPVSAANRTAAIALEAVWRLESGALTRAGEAADRFLEQEAQLRAVEPNDLLALEGIRDLLVGVAHLVRSVVQADAGDIVDARAALGSAFGLKVPLVDVEGLGIAATVAASCGQLRLAERSAHRAIELAQEYGFGDHRSLAAPCLALAHVARQRDDVVDAGRWLDQAEQRAGTASFIAKVIAAERAELALAKGHFDEAQALVAGSRNACVDSPSLALRWRGVEAQLAFAFGDAAQARAVLDRSSRLDGLEVANERVRIAVADRDLDAAARVLERWPDQPDPRARQLRTLWAAVISHATSGSADMATLSRAVVELEQEGQIGAFLEIGPPILGPVQPLYRVAPSPFLRRVLEHPRLVTERDAPPIAGLSETLTAQEMTVLSYLPGWISNAGIASRLGVSLNTIKTHMKHIYRKLDVTDRREAVAAAKKLGLL